jgi:hypothetical protein
VCPLGATTLHSGLSLRVSWNGGMLPNGGVLSPAAKPLVAESLKLLRGCRFSDSRFSLESVEF